jgi:hypothetical protein
VGSGGFIPYPGYEYFRNDLWYYNLTSSLWVEMVPEEGYPVPDPRMDMIFLLTGDLIFMHGEASCFLLLMLLTVRALRSAIYCANYLFITIMLGC